MLPGMPRTTVENTEGYLTTITSGDQTYHADEPVSEGGSGKGPKPSEMLLGALGSCVAITLRMYASRKGWPLEGVSVELDYERFKGAEYGDYDGEELFVHEFREAITLHGPLSDEQKAGLMKIATRCPIRRAIAMPAFFKDTLAG